MALTIEQKIAQKEAELARLKNQKRKAQTGQKVVIGGAILKAAKKNPEVAKWLAETLRIEVTREVDFKRIKIVIENLLKP